MNLKIEKIITIIIDLVLGSVVVAIGLMMLPFPLNMVWIIFNLWIWIVAPLTLLWAKKKTEEREGEIE